MAWLSRSTPIILPVGAMALIISMVWPAPPSVPSKITSPFFKFK